MGLSTLRTVGAPTTTELVERAIQRDEIAWREIVDRYTRLVWHVIHGVGLFGDVAADVHQSTWLHLAENIEKVHNPEALGSWLATTARRESIRAGKSARREAPTLDADVAERQFFDGGAVRDVEPPDGHLLDTERDALLWQAFAALPGQCQELLRLLLVDPPFSYDEISVILDMPKGSIGPTRIRCLERLRTDPRVAALEEQT